jgi:hypothetical protein
MAHCAWCGDPGDENGSHKTCPKHSAWLWTQLANRRTKRAEAHISGAKTKSLVAQTSVVLVAL